jgi:hypothetical protein
VKPVFLIVVFCAVAAALLVLSGPTESPGLINGSYGWCGYVVGGLVILLLHIRGQRREAERKSADNPAERSVPEERKSDVPTKTLQDVKESVRLRKSRDPR